MNYKQSEKIFAEIMKAKRILLNCHRNPDPDSIGSSLALRYVLERLGKTIKTICPTSLEGIDLHFLHGFNNIEFVEDMSKFSFGDYDLLITLDSSSWQQVLRDGVEAPKIFTINIDHHKTNTGYGGINLVDDSRTSTAEIVYLLLEDWETAIDKNLATALMAGIVGDTGAFQYPRVGAKTFSIAANLIDKGADKDILVELFYRSVDLSTMKFWSKVLERAKVDEDGKFFWSAISFEEYRRLGFGENRSPKASASFFAQMVDKTDFGFIAIEEGPQVLKISFRSRTGFDTSKIAQELNGGGHVYASGGKILGFEFDQAVSKLLDIVKKHVKVDSTSK